MRKILLQALIWIVVFLGWQQVVYFYVDNIANRLLFTAFDVGQVMLVFISLISSSPPFIFPEKQMALPGSHAHYHCTIWSPPRVPNAIFPAPPGRPHSL